MKIFWDNLRGRESRQNPTAIFEDRIKHRKVLKTLSRNNYFLLLNRVEMDGGRTTLIVRLRNEEDQSVVTVAIVDVKSPKDCIEKCLKRGWDSVEKDKSVSIECYCTEAALREKFDDGFESLHAVVVTQCEELRHACGAPSESELIIPCKFVTKSNIEEEIMIVSKQKQDLVSKGTVTTPTVASVVVRSKDDVAFRRQIKAICDKYWPRTRKEDEELYGSFALENSRDVRVSGPFWKPGALMAIRKCSSLTTTYGYASEWREIRKYITSYTNNTTENIKRKAFKREGSYTIYTTTADAYWNEYGCHVNNSTYPDMPEWAEAMNRQFISSVDDGVVENPSSEEEDSDRELDNIFDARQVPDRGFGMPSKSELLDKIALREIQIQKLEEQNKALKQKKKTADSKETELITKTRIENKVQIKSLKAEKKQLEKENAKLERQIEKLKHAKKRGPKQGQKGTKRINDGGGKEDMMKQYNKSNRLERMRKRVLFNSNTDQIRCID